jgi:hypothetical protein
VLITSYLVGHKLITQQMIPPTMPLSCPSRKKETHCSILSIYDTYGLSITRRYIEHLQSMASNCVDIYLIGCLIVLRLDRLEREMNLIGSYMHVSNLCSRIDDELVKLESKQPRMLGELEVCNIELPIHILATIILSNRVSKALTQARWIVRPCIPTRPLSSYQPGCTLIDEASDCFIPYVQDHLSMQWKMMDHLGSPVLICSSLINYDVNRVMVVEYSLHHYSRYTDVVRMLRDLSNRLSIVTEENKPEVRAWIVQLSYDTGRETMSRHKTFANLVELGDELQRLIQVATEQWTDQR